MSAFKKRYIKYLKRRKNMKKTAKTLLILALSVVMFLTSIPAFASNEAVGASAGVSPRLSHMGGGAFSFNALESGGIAEVSYEGYPDTFVQATVTFKVEKRFLLFFWNDIGEWTGSSTELWGTLYHIFELDGSGKYRCNMTLEVLGTDGTKDVIQDTIESSY